MTEDTQFANRKSRTESLDKLPVKSAQDAADEAYREPTQPQRLERVEIKPTPELDASVSLLDLIRANIELFWRQNIVKYFRGEPVENPLAPLSFLRTGLNLPTSLLIGLAVLGVLFVLLRWIV